MERRKVVAVTNLLEDLVGKQYALGELLGTVDYAVTYGVDFTVTADASQFGIGQDIKDSFYRTFVVDKTEFTDSLRAVGQFIFEKAVGKPDFFHAAFGHYFVI